MLVPARVGRWNVAPAILPPQDNGDDSAQDQRSQRQGTLFLGGNMKNPRSIGKIMRARLVTTILAAGTLLVPGLKAQSSEMQQRVADVKQALAVNKQMLAQYTWTEQDIISIKGEEKKEELYNVQLGPDGKPQKTPVDPNSMSDDERQRRGLRGRIIEKKTEEYQEYAQSIKTLIQQYVPPEQQLIEQARQQGNIMMGPTGAPNQFRLVISNYLKQGDSMTLVVNKADVSLLSLTIATYLSDPSDAVNVTVEFSRLPNGPNHVSTETINGVSKQLTIAVQNSNYQRM
jgi:hypothetical protein